MSAAWETLGTVCVAAGGFAGVLYPALARIMGRNERHRQQATAVAISAAVSAAKADITTQLDGAVRKLQDETTKRFDANDKASEAAARSSEAAATRLTRIEAQFGPNGGGLREKTNSIAEAVSSVGAKVEGLNDRFLDHLRQASDDRRRLSAVESALLRDKDRG